jgi:hydrogenase maturation protein HypF
VWLRDDREPYVLDWEPLLDGLLQDLRTGIAVEVLAGRFHATLVESIALVAHRVDRRVVLLTGGCFQNALLLEAAAGRLNVSGREPLWPRLLPPNDGGIAYGQLAGREGG